MSYSGASLRSPAATSARRRCITALNSASRSPASTSMCQGWTLPPEGAREALARTSRISAPGTGVGRKSRTDRRVSSASETVVAAVMGGAPQAGAIGSLQVGHDHPAAVLDLAQPRLGRSQALGVGDAQRRVAEHVARDLAHADDRLGEAVGGQVRSGLLHRLDRQVGGRIGAGRIGARILAEPGLVRVGPEAQVLLLDVEG